MNRVMWAGLVLLSACDTGAIPADAGACTTGATRACGMFMGECVPGTEQCVDGAWSGECEGGVGPVAETCNSLDDDCDGLIDGEAAAASCPAEPFATAYACTGFERCGITGCEAGRGNCTGEPGCDTVITSARDHCGGCGMRCDVDRTCDESICVALPETNWLWSGGGVDGERGGYIASSGSGGAYVTGSYSGAGQIGATTFSPRAGGGFVVEIDLEGRELWATESSLSELTIAGATTDAVWVHSLFYGSAVLGTRTVTSDPAMTSQVVAARVRSGGSIDWTWVTTNTGNFAVSDSLLLADGTLILAGRTTGTVDFAATRVSADEGSATVVAIDSSGAVQWVSTLAAPGFDTVRSMAATPSGELVIGVEFSAIGVMRGVTLTPGTAGRALVRLVDGIPTQQLAFDGILHDIAVGESGTYLVVQCQSGGREWPETTLCSSAQPSALVALDDEWTVRYATTLPRQGYQITTIDDQLVGAVADGSQLHLFDADEAGALRTWERLFSGVGSLSFDGRDLFVTTGFLASAAVEGRVVSSAGSYDALAWSARVR